MNPGRELDAFIATKVMGLDLSSKFSIFPRYSESISAAWEVVEKLRFKQIKLIELQDISGDEPDNEAHFYCRFGAMGKATASTAPHAICLAALKAVGHGL